MPLGRYRFHVEGTGYTLDSDPFEVVSGVLSVSATIAAGALTITASYDAPEGFRLLAMDGLSNRPVPVALGPLGVEVVHAGGAVESFAAALAGPGLVVVTPASVNDVVEVRVADRFGKGGAFALP